MNSSNRTYRSKPEWQSIVDQHRDSGLSARRFCEDKSINYVSFCNWRSKLTTSDAAVPLIDLSDLVNHSSGSSWRIELDLGGGVKLNLSQI